MPSSPALDLASPLTTREKRDKLVRKPLEKYAADDEQEEPEWEARRKLRPASVRSPPSVLASPTSKATSSPMDALANMDTPNMSRIHARQGEVDKSLTPRERSKSSAKKNASRSRTLSSDCATEDTESEESDDQPAALTKRANMTAKDNGSASEASNAGPSTSFCWLTCLCVLVAVVACASGAVYIKYPLPNRHMLFQFHEETLDDVAARNASLATLTDEMTRLKAEFPSQSKRTWSVVKASLTSLFSNERGPEQPSVILMLTEGEEAKRAAKCLAGNLRVSAARALSRPEDSKVFDRNDAYVREALQDLMDAELAMTSTFALQGLENLGGLTAMAFHAFCDNLQAPYKKAAIILVAEATASKDRLEKQAEEALSAAWSQELDEDRWAPILARVAVSTVRIQPEANLSC